AVADLPANPKLLYLHSALVPPTATPTKTPLSPTATPTNTARPPTATPTNTPVPPTATPTPTSEHPRSKEDCKDGKWRSFTNPSFKNQGNCIAYVAKAAR